AAERTVAPAAATGQNAGDPLAVVVMESPPLGKRQLVELVWIAGGRIEADRSIETTEAKPGNRRDIVDVVGQVADQFLPFAQPHRVEGGKIAQMCVAKVIDVKFTIPDQVC